ncbi:MAG: c-type cytochrome [Gammaproteobacteria bacterium]|nr:c-type cytochrome [Gammaproteobacteria bacterium]
MITGHLGRHLNRHCRRRFLTGCILALTGFMPTCAISTNANIAQDITQALELTPNVENGEKIYPLCASCHMKNGWGKKDGSFPVIAGQHRNVLIKQLSDIRSRNRENPTMFPFTDPASIGGMQGISDVTAYIASMAKDPNPGMGTGKDIELGKNIYKKRCLQCHGENGQGNNAAYFPSLKGQHHAYLLRQLKWIRDGYRKNANEAMVTEVKALSDEELDALADYLSRL